jgi:hypothetical protein
MKKIALLLLAILLNVAMGPAQNDKKVTPVTEKKQESSETSAPKREDNPPPAKSKTQPSTNKPALPSSAKNTKPEPKVPGKAERETHEEIKAIADTIIKAEIKAFQAQLQKNITDEFIKYNEDHPNNEFNEIRNLLNYMKLITIVLVILFIGLLAFIVIDKKGRREEILYNLTGRKKNSNGSRLKEWKNEIIKEAVAQSMDKPIKDTNPKTNDSEIKDLLRRITKLEDIQKEIEKAEIVKKEETLSLASQPRILYADAIVGDMFNKVVENANEETIYELLRKSPSATTSEFTLYEANKKQVLRNADKIDGCEKTGTNAGASGIQVEKGTAVLQDNGKWKIINKAKVKFLQ